MGISLTLLFEDYLILKARNSLLSAHKKTSVFPPPFFFLIQSHLTTPKR